MPELIKAEVTDGAPTVGWADFEAIPAGIGTSVVFQLADGTTDAELKAATIFEARSTRGVGKLLHDGLEVIPAQIATAIGSEQSYLIRRSGNRDYDLLGFAPLQYQIWISAADGLAFVRIANPSTDEQSWANSLSVAISTAIAEYLGDVILDATASDEITAAALRAFGYAWKYREAPFGEAQWLDEQGGAIRLAGDWLDPVKPILNRYRNVAHMIA